MTRNFGLDHIPRPYIPDDFGIPRREKWICRGIFAFAGTASGVAVASLVMALSKWWPLACL